MNPTKYILTTHTKDCVALLQNMGNHSSAEFLATNAKTLVPLLQEDYFDAPLIFPGVAAYTLRYIRAAWQLC